MQKNSEINEKQNVRSGGVKRSQEKSVDSMRGKDWYREKIVDMVSQIEDETMLKKIYTFTKTLKGILNEKERG